MFTLKTKKKYVLLYSSNRWDCDKFILKDLQTNSNQLKEMLFGFKDFLKLNNNNDLIIIFYLYEMNLEIIFF